ncbi:6292_t:CDS:2, partial [Gigaspora margarita]
QEGYDDHENIDKISLPVTRNSDKSFTDKVNMNVTNYDSNNDESLTNM